MERFRKVLVKSKSGLHYLENDEKYFFFFKKKAWLQVWRNDRKYLKMLLSLSTEPISKLLFYILVTLYKCKWEISLLTD